MGFLSKLQTLCTLNFTRLAAPAQDPAQDHEDRQTLIHLISVKVKSLLKNNRLVITNFLGNFLIIKCNNSLTLKIK